MHSLSRAFLRYLALLSLLSAGCGGAPDAVDDGSQNATAATRGTPAFGRTLVRYDPGWGASTDCADNIGLLALKSDHSFYLSYASSCEKPTVRYRAGSVTFEGTIATLTDSTSKETFQYEYNFTATGLVLQRNHAAQKFAFADRNFCYSRQDCQLQDASKPACIESTQIDWSKTPLEQDVSFSQSFGGLDGEHHRFCGKVSETELYQPSAGTYDTWGPSGPADVDAAPTDIRMVVLEKKGVLHVQTKDASYDGTYAMQKDDNGASLLVMTLGDRTRTYTVVGRQYSLDLRESGAKAVFSLRQRVPYNQPYWCATDDDCIGQDVKELCAAAEHKCTVPAG